MGLRKSASRAARKRRKEQEEKLKDQIAEGVMLDLRASEEIVKIGEKPAYMGDLHIGIAEVYSDFKVRIIVRDDLPEEDRKLVEHYIETSAGDFILADKED